MQYRYTREEGSTKYMTKTVIINRKIFPLPDKDNDFRFGIWKEQIDQWINCVAAQKKEDMNIFKKIQYEWDTTKPFVEGDTWNQFQRDFILNRHSAKQNVITRKR